MNEEVKIGVFVCRCGSNIAAVVDTTELVKYAKKLPNVVLADEGKWSCSADYLTKLGEMIKEYKINRIVVASCSPRTHESLFKQAVQNAGVNPYFLEFVSIREQVSWVHMDFPVLATQKAKDLVKMGVAKAALLEEGFEIRLPVNCNCLVIGGGVAGINAALSVADQGFKAFIVEREPNLGGHLRNLSFLVSENQKVPSSKVLSRILNKVSNNSNIIVLTESKIISVEGYIGNYQVKIRKNDGTISELSIDTIIVATGMRELEPKNQFCYGEDERIITQATLEKQIAAKKITDTDNVVMVSCVNSKNDQRGCCNIGCHITLKNAIALKILNKDSIVSIMYRDLSLYKKSGSMLVKAKRLGINFIRFSHQKYPEVKLRKNSLSVEVLDVLSGKILSLKADKVVLTTAFIGNTETEHIKELLKVSANSDDFFQEAHVKLSPLEFPSDGIGLCGCAKFPMFFEESHNEGVGAAMKVSIPMCKGHTKADGIVANINTDQCRQCYLCLKQCPYNAIIKSKNTYPEVIKPLCRGCGLCSADCPTSSISIVHYSDKQIFAQISAALEEDPGDKIIGFVCHWCALGGVDMAGVGRLQYSTNVRLIRVMCSARISIKMLEQAFKLGVSGVIVAGCEFPTCHYISGNYAAKKRIDRFTKKLEKKGFDSERLQVTWCSAADGPKFASVMNDMAKKLGFKRKKV